MAGVVALATILVQASVGAMGNELRMVSLVHRVTNTIVSYVAYLRMIVWPDRLAVFYPYPATLPPSGLVVACAVALVLVSAAVLFWRRSAPYLLVGWFWYLVTLFPVSGLFQAGDQLRADRFTYVPSIGIFVMVAWGVAQLAGRRRVWQRCAAAAAVILVLACGAAAHAQVQHWRNSETLWTRALAVTEGNHRAHASLAEVYAGQGKIDEAIAEYRAALRILPDVADWRNALGLLYLRQGRLAEAAGQFAIAVRLRPAFADAHTNLGAVLARAGRVKDAIAQYQEAARLTPNDASTRFNLSVVLQADGRTDDALAECLLALRLDPSKPDWHYQAAYLYSLKGNTAETRRYLEETLRLDPNHQAARSALARIGLLK
jgi:Tfp pilus assembly protein PilF